MSAACGWQRPGVGLPGKLAFWQEEAHVRRPRHRDHIVFEEELSGCHRSRRGARQQDLKNVEGADQDPEDDVENGKIAAYRVNMKIPSFSRTEHPAPKVWDLRPRPFSMHNVNDERAHHDNPDGTHRGHLASRVIGTPVYNTEGYAHRQHRDIMLDETSNGIMFAVIGFGGFLGIGVPPFRGRAWTMTRTKFGYVVPSRRNS
jgi:hypothetical protein